MTKKTITQNQFETRKSSSQPPQGDSKQLNKSTRKTKLNAHRANMQIKSIKRKQNETKPNQHRKAKYENNKINSNKIYVIKVVKSQRSQGKDASQTQKENSRRLSSNTDTKIQGKPKCK